MRKLLLSLLAALVLTTCAAAYDDVPEGHWAAAAVAEMTEAHVATGFPDGTFRPDAPVSRAQFLAMILRAVYPEEIPQAESGEDWWRPYYDLAGQNGLLLGGGAMLFPEGTDLTDSVTRCEMAVLLDNANARWNGLRLTAGWAADGRFTDGGSIPALYAAGVESAAAGGLLTGYPDGAFRGERTMTRAEACAVLSRLRQCGGLLDVGETQVAYTGGILIKQRLKNDGSAVLTSVRAQDGAVLQTLSVPMDGYEAFAEQRRDDPTAWAAAWGRTVTGTDGSSFWGEAGYYTYSDDGAFTQWTDRAVVSWVRDPSGDGVLAVSHAPGKRIFYFGGGVNHPAGDEVVRLLPDGTETVLLSDTPAHGLTLTRITGAEGDAIRVCHEAVYGMADLHVWEYAVEHGKLRALEHTPGAGWSGYTPEEAAAEQSRLDRAGVGVGS